jgi:hypothetical protein
MVEFFERLSVLINVFAKPALLPESKKAAGLP